MSSREKKNLYEGMFVLSAALSDDVRQQAFNKLTDGIVEKKGEIHKIHQMGKRRLAYDIANHRDGHYYLVYFSVAPEAIKTLWQEYRLNEQLLRFITLRADSVRETLEFKELVEQ